MTVADFDSEDWLLELRAHRRAVEELRDAILELRLTLALDLPHQGVEDSRPIEDRENPVPTIHRDEQ